jgi:hypothetical protein
VLVVNTKTKGFTQVANDLIRAKTLTASQKLLLIGLQSFAFGSKRVVFPSQAELGRCLRLDRKTIRKDTPILAERGYFAVFERGQGLEYHLNIADWPDLCKSAPGESTPIDLGKYPQVPGESTPTNNNNKEYLFNNTLADLVGEATDAPRADDLIGNDTVSTMLSVTNSPGDISPGQICSGRGGTDGSHDSSNRRTLLETNEYRLTPEGRIASNDPDDTESKVYEAFVWLGRSGLLSTVVADLIEKYGAREVSFQASWLARRVAVAERRGTPIANVEGYLRRAISGKPPWDVTQAMLDEPEPPMRAPMSVTVVKDEIEDTIPF